MVFNAGEDADRIYGIVSGRVHLFRSTAKGRRIAVDVLVRGDIFGVRWDWRHRVPQYDVTAVVKEPTVLVEFPAESFVASCLSESACAQELCEYFAQKLKAAYDLRCLSQETMLIRMASALTALHTGFGDVVPLTKKELSELIDATQETTFRTISRLQRSGHIESLRGGIRIVDRKGLESLLPN
ncbi:MAG: Crp/Fnr family transcriptional regulator [Elusimicrobia bacterium]|nr:Crp/Fnr family transcriptional regulator [Elusimicrobiota bacterium]